MYMVLFIKNSVNKDFCNKIDTKYLDNPLELIKRAQKYNDNKGSAIMLAVILSGNNLKYCYLGGTRISYL